MDGLSGGVKFPDAAFCRIGAWAAVILLCYSLLTMVILVALGVAPEDAQACFAMIRENVITALLRLDILTVVALPVFFGLYVGTYAALRRDCYVLAAASCASAAIGVTLVLANASPMSLLYLSDQYAAATNELRRAQLLAAGEAVMSTDMWHGTAAKMGGLLLQIAGVLISVAMLRTAVFSKLTGYSGLLTHGLDLLHIVIGFFAPKASVLAMAVAGPIYLLWFPLVARRLLQLAQRHSAVGTEVLPNLEAKTRPVRQ